MKQINLLVCLLLCVTITRAQSTESKQPGPTKTAAAKSAAQANAEVELKERRARARALLVSLSSDARTFQRSNTACQIARANCRCAVASRSRTSSTAVSQSMGSRGSCRSGKRQETSGRDSANKKLEPAAVMQSTCRPTYVVKFCRLAARHDRALGEEFLEKLKAQKVESATDVNLTILTVSATL